MPASLPETAILLSDLVKLWPDVMPTLRDQGEADRMNTLLGNMLVKFHGLGKTVPPMVFISDAPSDRPQDGQIDPTYFRLAYDRWSRSPLFRKFWESLSPEDQKAFFVELRRM